MADGWSQRKYDVIYGRPLAYVYGSSSERPHDPGEFFPQSWLWIYLTANGIAHTSLDLWSGLGAPQNLNYVDLQKTGSFPLDVVYYLSLIIFMEKCELFIDAILVL